MIAFRPSWPRHRLLPFAAVTPVAAALASFAGCLVLVGWTIDASSLTSIVPGLVRMNPLTALSFVLAGAALWLVRADERRADRSRWVSQAAFAAAGSVWLVGLITLVGYLLGRNLGVDQVLFSGSLDGNRISPNAGVNFLLVGIGLLLLQSSTDRDRRLVQLLALTSGFGALLAIVGYAYGANDLYGVAGYIPMALNTALAFVVLDVGILAARPTVGPMALARSSAAGGVVLRRLLPITVGSPIVLGWLRLRGQQAGLYDVEFGTALVAVGNVGILAAVVVALARTLDRSDASRLATGAELDRFFTLSPDLFGVADADGYFRRINPAFERTLGFVQSELAAEPFLSFVHPDDRSATLAEVATPATGAPTIGFENRYRCKDGTYRWLSWTAAPAASKIYAVGRDITEQRLAADELRQAKEVAENASRLKSSFLSTVSHELRTPMTSIKGYVELLLDGEVGDLTTDQRTFLEVVRANTDRLARLVNDVLDLSKIEAGRLDLSPETIDLAAIVEQVRAELAPQAVAKGLLLAVEIPAGLPPLEADPARLHQILLNLAANAIKFTAEGRVAITARVGRNGVDVAVADTGIGIEPEALAFVFDEFRQADDGISRRFGGTGLGLSISHKLAELHGGTITAASVPGAGSTFTLTLPVVASTGTGATAAPSPTGTESATATPASAAAVKDDGRDAPVLLIEDDPDCASLVRLAVEAEGRRLVHTTSGADGLQLAADLRPELVLLDILLDADLDGWQVLHGLRTDPATAGLPVAVVSVCEDRRLAAALGATDYLVKPIDRSGLASALRRFGTRPPAEVLIVDDEPAVREVLARLLTAHGYRVRCAEGGADALQELARETPDLLVLDLMMPDCDGAAVLTAVRATPATRYLPVLVVTAQEIGPEDLAWLGQHTADLLPKSALSTDTLIAAVRAALNGRSVPVGAGAG